MGGFVLAPSQETLTPQGVLNLADLGEVAVAKTTKASIMDRSKADGIGKLLICFQAAWMIIQCIGRLANQLPLTMLEINTLGHVFCALALYTIWYHKPQDMNDPISLHIEVSDSDLVSDLHSRSSRAGPFSTPEDIANWSVKEFSKSFTIQ